jgi:uncharacterized protein
MMGLWFRLLLAIEKKATGGLDDIQLRDLDEHLHYLRELGRRWAVIILSIEEQDKMTDSLRVNLESADRKSRLEDLYLPYKPRRRTKAHIAREAGLEPLAKSLFSDPSLNPQTDATNYLRLDVDATQRWKERSKFWLSDLQKMRN